jgi:hypothetical protein
VLRCPATVDEGNSADGKRAQFFRDRSAQSGIAYASGSSRSSIGRDSTPAETEKSAIRFSQAIEELGPSEAPIFAPVNRKAAIYVK